MYNGLNRLFKFLNLRYKCEIQKNLCFAKHHSLTHTLSLYILYFKAKFFTIFLMLLHLTYVRHQIGPVPSLNVDELY
jgi:hypothetical protein